MNNKWEVKKEIRVWGIQRSGNHAIINWIIKQSQGNVFYLNHGDPLTPFEKHREYREPEQPIDLFIHSYENCRFSPQLLKIANAHRARSFDSPQLRLDVLVLRDPFNLFASRIKSGYVSSGREDRYNQADLWLYYAAEYLGRTNYLGANKLVVNYNRWCKDLDYRKMLAERMALTFTDAGFNEVSKYGGGSSFDGVNLNGQASVMQTEDRWTHYRSNPVFLSYFKDPLIMSLHEKAFGELKGTREFIQPVTSGYKSFKAWLRGRFVRHVVMPLIDFRLWLDCRPANDARKA